MPSSPLTAETLNRESALAKRLSELDKLMDQGVGLSGHERNCAFLNVGGKHFATASAAMGLDFEDDARAPALVDWDRDGDLDLWMANRSAPMLRFARNQSASDQAWLAVRLQGTRTNRDGIGGRVQIRLTNGRTFTKTLKAGEGYLAQSSKWLHFGLGLNPTIEEVLVTWAGGTRESFTGIAPNKRFRLIEGKGVAMADAATMLGRFPTSKATLPTVKTSVRSLSAASMPLPRLPYTTFEGETRYAGLKSKNLTLVNLWATWCQPCQVELREFSRSAPAFAAAGIDVLPLSVDAAEADPAAFYQKLGCPFPSGRASEKLVRRLELAYTALYGLRWPLPVPTSALLDQDGKLISFYKGAVSPEQILADTKTVSLGQEAKHDAALPLPGRWMFRPQPLDPIRVAIDLMDRDQLEAARELANRAAPVYRERLTEYVRLLTWIGDASMKQGLPKEALASYRSALEADATATLVMNNLAWQLAAHPEASIRDGEEAVRWASKAAELTKQADPSILDTLAAAYAEAGDFEQAVRTAQKASELAKAQRNQPLWKGIQAGLRKYRLRKSYISE